MDIKTFGVIGAGQMGNGIAQVAAVAGLSVIMSDIKPEFCDKGMAFITKTWIGWSKRKRSAKRTKPLFWNGSPPPRI